MKILYKMILFVFYIHFFYTQCFSQTNALNGLSIEKVLTKTFELKNNYEKACQEKIGIKQRRSEYQSALRFLKRNRVQFIPLFEKFVDSIKATNTLQTRVLNFRYLSPFSSTIRHCDLLFYEDAIKAVLVYLRNEKAQDLICPFADE